MNVKLSSAPATEPLSLTEAKLHLHFDDDVTAEDTLLTTLISVARSMVEQFTGRALITQTWEMYLDNFPNANFIKLPFGKLQSVTSITTTDSTGEETVLTATTQYLVNADSDPGRIVLPYAESWPSLEPYPVNPIKIIFICGYGAAGTVPDPLKAAMKLIIGDLYENRESQTIDRDYVQNRTALNLMLQYKLWDRF